ncbi:hypothetical protein [Ruegeria meonggei]|uniref:Lipoprotein n=1 Tax=Ruegeria meonggei TaxID=1446476 RepID=A0A1X7A9V9_9RHOB|nr:hypothetical protein [Ruegeria meonggei]SLN74125.1 hypothetical protein RUM8411_03968 [Ruegeria meonggei]
MRSALFLTVAVALSACNQPSPANTVTEAELQGSCEALVSAETGVRPDDVSAISTQTQPSGSVTTLSVAGAQAPWLCRADPFGVITGVEYSQEG